MTNELDALTAKLNAAGIPGGPLLDRVDMYAGKYSKFIVINGNVCETADIVMIPSNTLTRCFGFDCRTDCSDILVTETQVYIRFDNGDLLYGHMTQVVPIALRSAVNQTPPIVSEVELERFLTEDSIKKPKFKTGQAVRMIGVPKIRVVRNVRTIGKEFAYLIDSNDCWTEETRLESVV